MLQWDTVLVVAFDMVAAEEAFVRLAGMPSMGPRWNASAANLEGIRFWPVPGFQKYLVFYLPIDGGIRVLRVVHGSRNLARILAPDVAGRD